MFVYYLKKLTSIFLSKYPINVALSDIFLADPIFYKTPVKTFILATKLSSPTQKALYSIAFLCVVVVVEMNCELTLLISLVILNSFSYTN